MKMLKALAMSVTVPKDASLECRSRISLNPSRRPTEAETFDFFANEPFCKVDTKSANVVFLNTSSVLMAQHMPKKCYIKVQIVSWT